MTPAPPTRLIIACARRWRTLAAAHGTEIPGELETTIRLIRAHRNGCPMDWAALAAASDADIEHDVGALVAHFNPREVVPGGLIQPRYREA